MFSSNITVTVKIMYIYLDCKKLYAYSQKACFILHDSEVECCFCQSSMEVAYVCLNLLVSRSW